MATLQEAIAFVLDDDSDSTRTLSGADVDPVLLAGIADRACQDGRENMSEGARIGGDPDALTGRWQVSTALTGRKMGGGSFERLR